MQIRSERTTCYLQNALKLLHIAQAEQKTHTPWILKNYYKSNALTEWIGFYNAIFVRAMAKRNK